MIGAYSVWSQDFSRSEGPQQIEKEDIQFLFFSHSFSFFKNLSYIFSSFPPFPILDYLFWLYTIFFISLSDSFFIMKTHYYFLYFHLYLPKRSLILLTCSKCAIYNSTIFSLTTCVCFFFPNLFSLFLIHSSLFYSSVTFLKTFRFYQSFIFFFPFKERIVFNSKPLITLDFFPYFHFLLFYFSYEILRPSSKVFPLKFQ